MGKKGFTLIELLVVMAIIVILASLLSAALAQAHKCGRRISCKSSLRQLTIAWHLYADDNKDRIVANKTQGEPTQSTQDSWVTGSVKTPAPADWRNSGGVQFGALYPYTRSCQTYRCPSDLSTNSRSFAMNPGLNWFDDTTLPDPLPTSAMARTRAQLSKPIDTFVLLDESLGSIDDGFFGINWAPSSKWLNLPATRHNDRQTPLSFSDGHVSDLHWLAPKRWSNYDQDTANTDDLADLCFLQSKVLPQ